MHRARKLVAGIVSAASMIVGVVGFAPAVAHGATCNGLFTIDYVGAPNFALPGDTVRVRLTLGTGSIQGGTELSVNRLRFYLDCNGDFGLAVPCTDEGSIVEYEGDSTITTTCDGVTWSSTHATSATPNEVVFTPSTPVDIPADTPVDPGFCNLEFDVKVLTASTDGTPDQIEETTGYLASADDASCDNTLSSSGQQSSSIPLCPSCPISDCADSVCNQDTGSCMSTAKPASTPCTDTDGNACTTAGCDGRGVCDQSHLVKTCPPDTNECTDDPPCNPQTGTCEHPPKPASTPCTDTDGNACTTAGCDGNGVCSQTHVMCATTSTTTPTSTTTTTSTVTATTQPETTPTTTTTTTTSTTSSTTTTVPGGCRVTGGGRIDQTSPAVNYATHGGQVGAPLGFVTAFSPATPCIQGSWEHVRHDKGGNLHAKSFDSLVCGCLPCPGDPDPAGHAGALCNPGDRICGPEPPRAPANKICFTGVAGLTLTNGKKDRDAAFRVDVEDHGEPGGSSGPPPPDRYRMRIWVLSGDPDGASNLALRQSISCGASLDEDIGAPPPDIDDGGDTPHGNLQIHPEINHKACP